MPGTDARDPLDLAEPVERREVLHHVAAALRVHHGGGAVEHVIAGEQRALLVEQEAQVVRRVAGRVDRLEAELGAVDRVAVGEHEIEIEVHLVGLGELPERADHRAGLLADAIRRRPVVGMRVREQHPLHAVAHRRADDRLDVLRDIGTGIDHRDFVDADEVGVRARSGHQTGIVRDDAPDQRRERARHLGSHGGHDYSLTSPRRRARRGRRSREAESSTAPWVDFRRQAARRAHRFLRRALGGIRSDPWRRVEVVEEIARMVVAREHAQAHLGREDQIDRIRRRAREARRPGAPNPTRRARCRRARRLRRRAPARRRTRCCSGAATERCEPVREQPQLRPSRTSCRDSRRSANESSPAFRDPARGRKARVVLDRLTALPVVGEENACFFEALAQRRDPEREAALGHTVLGAGGAVVEADDTLRRP